MLANVFDKQEFFIYTFPAQEPGGRVSPMARLEVGIPVSFFILEDFEAY